MNKILKKQAFFMLVVFLLSVILNSVAMAGSANSIFGSSTGLLNISHETKGKEVSYSIALDKAKINSKKGTNDQQFFLTNEFSKGETFDGEMFLNGKALTKGSHEDWDMMIDANGSNKQIASLNLAILQEGTNEITFKTTVAEMESQSRLYTQIVNNEGKAVDENIEVVDLKEETSNENNGKKLRNQL